MKNNLADGVINTEYEPSEGERFIAYFLDEEGIDFKQEVPIVNLRNDTKHHRRADFYLPKYKIYVEFYGRWNNSKEDREQYREKKKVFFENNIPCIYLYPENLGIIEFSFHERIQAELKRHNLRKQLFKYLIKIYLDDYRENLFWLTLFSLVLIFVDWNWNEDNVLIFILFAAALYQLYTLVDGYIYTIRNTRK